MAESLSPNPTVAQKNKPRIPASTLQSPTSPFFLGSNDDNLERAQARAARAAALRRKSLAVNSSLPDPDSTGSGIGLGKQQILDLFNNCIKLASENKINQKNTWELDLIDHLCEIIQVEEEQDVETNFQKASCTLEAGVKIYSLRVDSVHSEAYKVLGGINRVGHEDNQDSIPENPDERGEKDGGLTKKEIEKLSPTSTLESSFDALNVKKFDAAFAVDPLYHQTTAQFDEGGAKGLLLNNLGVYGSCKVLFDSSEVPGKCVSSMTQHDKDDLVDLAFVRDQIDQMVLKARDKNEISPTLSIIISQFDNANQRQEFQSFDDYTKNVCEPFSANERSVEEEGGADCVGPECNADSYDYGASNFEDDEHAYTFDQDPGPGGSFSSEHYERTEDMNLEVDDRFGNIDTYLFQNLGISSRDNAWAGPDHWKYRKPKVALVDDRDGEEKKSGLLSKKPKKNKKEETDIDFTAALNADLGDVFAPPKNSKSLLLSTNRATGSTMLPEDCHYQPENLVKLFLLPNVMCLGKRSRKRSDMMNEQSDDYGGMPSWEDENGNDGPFDDGNGYSDVDDPCTLVSQPRQVNRIEVQYDKTSKQVDVQELKEVLWKEMKDCSAVCSQGEPAEESSVSFRDILGSFPGDCTAAATLEDISPHLCFICLLHLANEHGLRIDGSSSMDELTVYLPLCGN